MFWQLLIVLVLLIPVLAIVLDSQLGRALAARLERPGVGAGNEDVLTDRLAFLEGEVERLSTEVERLADESDFLHKLLAERPAEKALPPGPSGTTGPGGTGTGDAEG